jgi:hypothetical protein
LYKPERPQDKKNMIVNYTKLKTPHFFIYAKDKTEDQVEPVNKSVVNKLEKIIPNPRINFNATNLGRFNHKMLMNNKNIESNQDIIDIYTELDLKKHFMIDNSDDGETNNVTYLYNEIKNKILKINNDINYVVDVLVEYLYKDKKSSYKTTLWECFGDIIVDNLRNNINKSIEDDYILCEVCGERIEDTTSNKKYCKKCAKKINIQKTIENRKEKKKLFEANKSCNP